MSISRESIIEVLSNIIEPETNKDLISSNLVEKIDFENQTISIEVYTPNPALHARKKLQEQIEFALRKVFGDSISTTTIVKALPTESMKARRKILPDVKNIIAIASGKGGVGKSTITANLAGGLVKKGFSVGIVDADIYGPSMPTMFDLVGERPKMIDIDGEGKIAPIESQGIKILSIGFFTEQDNAVVWRGPMAAKALTQMFTDAHWGELDYLLIDLPPGTGDIHLSLIQAVPLDGAVVVSTPQEVALADARKGVNMFKLDTFKVPVIGIVENMSWFTPAELPDNKYYIFGRDGAKNLAEGMDTPFLGHIPLIQSVREAGDIGRPAVYQENTLSQKYFDELTSNFVKTLEDIKKLN